MKIVINNCFGGFSLSPKAIKRLAELQGRECYFYRGMGISDPYTPMTLEEASNTLFFMVAFDHPDVNKLFSKPWEECNDAERKQRSQLHDKHYLESRPDDRTDPLLIQVVEELGEEASGICAKLKIIEIPDGIAWEISEYDGNEHVAEKHQTWC